MARRFECLTGATCLACVIVFTPQAFAQSGPLYTVIKTVPLGTPDRWDFDGEPGKLTVIDPKSDSSVATVDVGGKLESAVAGLYQRRRKEGDRPRRYSDQSGRCALADHELH